MSAAAQARVRALPCWRGPIAFAPLGGGLSNVSMKVRDSSGVYVARVGEDLPFHHVSRQREAAAQRAAHACGLAPRLIYAGAGAMVCDFIEGRTLTDAGVRDRIETIAAMLRRCHVDVARKVRGEAMAFWPFHVLRDYLGALAAAEPPMREAAARFDAIISELEDAQTPMPIAFGHHDLLPANFVEDDNQRLWLIDWEYAGFGTATFDLANLSANADFTDADDRALLAAYFGRAKPPGWTRAFAAMKVASALREGFWAMVCKLHMDAPGVDYAHYADGCMVKFEAAYTNFRDRYR